MCSGSAMKGGRFEIILGSRLPPRGQKLSTPEEGHNATTKMAACLCQFYQVSTSDVVRLTLKQRVLRLTLIVALDSLLPICSKHGAVHLGVVALVVVARAR